MLIQDVFDNCSLMVVNSLRQRSFPAAENSFLMRTASVDSKVGETEINGEVAKEMNFRRERMKLRRIRSLAGSNFAGDSILFPDCDVSLKKRRSEIPKESKSIADAKFSSTIGTAASRSHGLISVIGRRRQMEDAVAVELGFLTKGQKSYDFFGVYDGHGGYRVAHACRDMLHKLLAKIVAKEINSEGIINWEKVMVAGFKKMDEEINKNGTSMATMGSTAVVAVVGDEEVVIANCGDSRAVISRGGVAVQLLDDHKPDRPDELERIELSGGKVINWNGQRVLGVLATSRSIGDQYLKPFVITEPEVKVINTTELDEFLILASDGLWDVVSNDLACKVARRCLNGQLRRKSKFSRVVEGYDNNQFNETLNEKSRAFEAAAFLTELAIARGSKDNISITIVELNHSTSGSSV